MIVCICNNVNTALIVEAIESGAHTIDAIREQTGAGNCCGKCVFQVHRLIQENTNRPEQASKSFLMTRIASDPISVSSRTT